MEISAKISICIAMSIASLSIGALEGKAQNIFNVVEYGAIGDGQTDDYQAFQKGWEELCAANNGGLPTLNVPSGKTFLVTSLKFQGPCKSTRINFQILGNMVAPKTAYKDAGWLNFKDVDGLILNGTGQIDGRGSIWWLENVKKREGYDVNSRPTTLRMDNCKNVEISGLTQLNSPRNHISLEGCSQVSVSGVNLIAPNDSPNTDGIDIAASNQVYIHDSYIGTGDDCIAINGGSSYVNISKVTCGPGHGISVGSLGLHGNTETVEEVHVWNCTFNGTENGARIKTWQGGSGYARNINFEQLIILDSRNPIIINQYYCENGFDCSNQTSAVEISNVTFRGVQGTSASDIAISLRCSKSVACTNINVLDVDLTSSNPGKTLTAECFNARGTFTSSDTPNITCSLP